MKLKKNFWIRVLLFCIMTLSLAVPGSWAATMTTSQQTQVIQSLESTLFAVRYDQETSEARVVRLEEVVFGQKQTGSLDARIGRLKSALSPKALGPLSPLPKHDNSTASTRSAPANQQQTTSSTSTPRSAVNTTRLPGGQATGQPATSKASQTPAPNETDYPTISEMERKLFNKTYTNEDITARLARLEKEVFKVPQTGTLAERSDNLRMVVLGDLGNGPPAIASYPAGGYIPAPGPAQSYTPPQYGNAYPPSGNGAYSSYGGSYPGGTQVSSQSPPYYGQPGNYQQPPSYSSGSGDYQASYQPGTNPASMSNGQISPDMLAALDEIEKQIIGHTYPSEPITTRLDRLENKVFKTTSPELAPQERMQRVIAVASAGGAPSSPQTKAKNTFQTLLPIILTILPLLLL